MQRILLIEPADRHDSLRDTLEAGGGDVMLARVARSSLAWPLSRPTLILLHGFAAGRAADLLAQLRRVGFDMPALVVTTEIPANGRSHLDAAGRSIASASPGRFVVEGDGLEPLQLGAALTHIVRACGDSTASRTEPSPAEESDARSPRDALAGAGEGPVATAAAHGHRRRRGAGRGPQAA